MKRTLLGLLVAVSTLCASRAAAQTTIDFDDLSASTCVYGSAPDLDVQYAAMGVTFSGDIGTFPKVVPGSCLTITGGSSPNVVGLSGSGNYLRADFAPSVASVSMAVGNYNRVETFTLTAYDTDGATLATAMLSPPYRTFARISVAASGISYAVLTAAHSENAVDDVTFASTVIPADAGVDAGVDAGDVDAGVVDAGDVDAGDVDAGDVDAGDVDAGDVDAGDVDAGDVDAGGTDAGTPDAGAPDAGRADAGHGDAATTDAGPPGASGGGCCHVASGASAPWPVLMALGAFVLARARRRR